MMEGLRAFRPSLYLPSASVLPIQMCSACTQLLNTTDTDITFHGVVLFLYVFFLFEFRPALCLKGFRIICNAYVYFEDVWEQH
jgi:hypothetical protein